MLTDYSNLTASPNTPEYVLKKGIQILKYDECKATMTELKDNLIGQGCDNMQTGKVKAHGCGDG